MASSPSYLLEAPHPLPPPPPPPHQMKGGGSSGLRLASLHLIHITCLACHATSLFVPSLCMDRRGLDVGGALFLKEGQHEGDWEGVICPAPPHPTTQRRMLRHAELAAEARGKSKIEASPKKIQTGTPEHAKSCISIAVLPPLPFLPPFSLHYTFNSPTSLQNNNLFYYSF